MENLFRFLALLLITRIVASFDCPLGFRTECECQIGYINRDAEMNCPGPFHNSISKNPMFPFKYFKISFLPRKHVHIQCHELPDWDTFHYNISSEVQNTKLFILKNCMLQENTNVGKIVKLTGAENSEKLYFVQNLRTKFVISKNNLQGFSNVKKLNILQTYKLTNISDDLLEYLPNLTHINLSGNKLKTIPEKIFQNVTKLTVLRLEDNLIESLKPKNFKKLSKLTFLALFQNKIVELKPHMFDDLTSLKILHLQENNLTSLPEDIFEKLANLNAVNLMKNSFESLPADLFQNNLNLTKINLQHNLLKTVPKGLFSNLSNLKEIYLAVNALECLPEDLFRELSKLEILDIGKNYLQTLPEKIFHGLYNLKKLNLQQNRLTTISSSLLTGLRSLEVFIADGNQIETIHKDAFKTLVKLQIIQLSHNKINSLENENNPFFESSSVFSSCRALKELHLSFNNISKILKDWTVFAGKEFEFLDLSHNSITELRTLAIKKVDNLGSICIKSVRLNLSNNKIRRVNLQGLDSVTFETHKFVDISENPIVCDVWIYDFLRYLDGSMSKNVTSFLHMKMGNLQCTNPKEYKDTYLSKLNRQNIRFNINDFQVQGKCPELCNCQVNLFEKILIIDCANRNFTEAPEINCSIDRVHDIELNLRNNFLKEVPHLDRKGFYKVKRLLL